MKPEQIKLKRTESVLKELIPEALGQLGDERLHEVDVLDVHCSRGKSDAKVYLDPSYFDESEQKAIIKQLEKARPIIENHCMKEQGWFKSPKLTFVFDDTYERAKKIDELFAMIEKAK